MAKAHGERRLEERLSSLAKPKLLVVDELGYLPLEPDAAHLFFQLVSRRYENGAMLITSNRSISEWGTVFGDTVVATAILDRLLHQVTSSPSEATATNLSTQIEAVRSAGRKTILLEVADPSSKVRFVALALTELEGGSRGMRADLTPAPDSQSSNALAKDTLEVNRGPCCQGGSRRSRRSGGISTR